MERNTNQQEQDKKAPFWRKLLVASRTRIATDIEGLSETAANTIQTHDKESLWDIIRHQVVGDAEGTQKKWRYAFAAAAYVGVAFLTIVGATLLDDQMSPDNKFDKSKVANNVHSAIAGILDPQREINPVPVISYAAGVVLRSAGDVITNS